MRVSSYNLTSLTLLFVILATSQVQGFFLYRDDDLDGVENRSTNLTQNAILGVYDVVTGLTHGVGAIFDQFEDGFERIRPNKTVINKVSVSDEEDDSSLGSSAVQGLFSSLRNLNKNVGKLVYIVGDTLTERRDQVEDIASNVDTRVFLGSKFRSSISILIILGYTLRAGAERVEETKLWIYSQDGERVRGGG